MPSLRARYLGYVRDIAEQWLDWKTLGPLITHYQSLIADALKDDTRKLSSSMLFKMRSQALPKARARAARAGPSA